MVTRASGIAGAPRPCRRQGQNKPVSGGASGAGKARGTASTAHHQQDLAKDHRQAVMALLDPGEFVTCDEWPRHSRGG